MTKQMPVIHVRKDFKGLKVLYACGAPTSGAGTISLNHFYEDPAGTLSLLNLCPQCVEVLHAAD